MTGASRGLGRSAVGQALGAGHRVVGRDLLAAAPKLLVAADVNAVPPSGIEGIDAMDDGKTLHASSGKAVGIGALAIGNIKYKTEFGLFQKMIGAAKPLQLDFRDAFAFARELHG